MENNDLFGLDIKNLWIPEEESSEEIEKYYNIFNTEMEKVYQFTLSYYDSFYRKRDYGSGFPMSMLEIHVLTEINDTPGITVTKLANRWRRTTSALSQIISSFEDANLVSKIRNGEDAKVNNLFITEKGRELVLKHKQYDSVDTVKTLKKLLKDVDEEDLRSFFNVIDLYKNILIDVSNKEKEQ